MKILMVNTKCGFWGGVERYIFDSAKLLREQRMEISGFFEEKVDFSEKFSTVFHEYKIFDNQSVNSFSNWLNKFDVVFIHKIESLELLSYLTEHFHSVLVVHDHDYYCIRKHKYFPYKRKNCFRPFHPAICSLCSGWLQRQQRGFRIDPHLLRNFTKRLKMLKKMDAFIVLSDYMKRNLILNRFEEEKIQVIHPFSVCDTQKSSESSEEKSHLNLLYVGQLIRGKGVDLLIRIVNKISCPYHLHIVGTGNDETFLKHQVGLYGLQNKVTFVGWTNDVSSYYQNTDLVLVPSRWQEPFGLIGIEAYCHKKPVIAFDIGGTSEWLQDNKTGFIIPSMDCDKFADKINWFFENPDELKFMGENGNKLLKKEYSKELFINSYLKIMERVNVSYSC